MRSYLVVAATFTMCMVMASNAVPSPADPLERDFLNPPDTARPWVYWFWMDGNSSREGITADFEAMKRAGIGGVEQMEVDVGVPRGPVHFMSPEWQQNFNHAVREAGRLGLKISILTGPGWTGSGGPWVKPEQSMQKVVCSETTLTGPQKFGGKLPQPAITAGFYRDIAVLAFPTPAQAPKIENLAEKALFHRGHFSSEKGVRSYIPDQLQKASNSAPGGIPMKNVIDLSSSMDSSGTLNWDVPPGNWTILRFGHTSTGANTRPAPLPGLGLECDKLDRDALAAHYAAYLEPILKNAGPLAGRSLAALHIDSWEMGSQNWSAKFRDEFRSRRGYDPVPWLPVMFGHAIESLEKSERFLWDLRQTVNELIVDNHARASRDIAAKSGMSFSIEPYDGTPCDDLTFGGVADVPMCEFWSNTFDTWYSCFEAASIAHTYGRSVVGAEAFTAGDGERWYYHPAYLKTVGDWAFTRGVNRFAFHRYAHQPWLDRWPGMTMGPYGIHYERTQTWWDMVGEYNKYLARCQAVLQQGVAVADVCYLSPEGAPHVFDPPASALTGTPPDPRTYDFDACTPEALMKARVVDGRIAFPKATAYAVLVLPRVQGMSPELLLKVEELTRSGATVVGAAPNRAPGLGDWPKADQRVREIAGRMWDDSDAVRKVGKGMLISDPGGGEPRKSAALVEPQLYADYSVVRSALERSNVLRDFESSVPLRYTHRRVGDRDVYFVANLTTESVTAKCMFRVQSKTPEIWDPMDGSMAAADSSKEIDGRTAVELTLEPTGSRFVVFAKNATHPPAAKFAVQTTQTIAGPWTVAFQPGRGAPEQTVLSDLVDLSKHDNADVRHFSGIATYTTTFPLSAAISGAERLTLDLGEVNVMARVKVNGREVGIVWKPPYQLDVSKVADRSENVLSIEVANLWPNRLIGDSWLPEDKRITKTTWNPFKPDTPLPASGLVGPVTLRTMSRAH